MPNLISKEEEASYYQRITELAEKIKGACISTFVEDTVYQICQVNPESSLEACSTNYPDVFVFGQVGEVDDDSDEGSNEDLVPEFQLDCAKIIKAWTGRHKLRLKFSSWWILLSHSATTAIV